MPSNKPTSPRKPKQLKTAKPKPSMNPHDLIEALADKEHASWARWQAYLHSKCERQEDGSLVIPAGYVVALEKLITAPYAELAEQTKQSDREEVAHILPIIRAYAEQRDPSEPRTFPVLIALVMTLDGAPKGQINLQAVVEVPPEGQGVQLSCPVDARELQQILEKICGPALKSILWTPDKASGPVALATKG